MTIPWWNDGPVRDAARDAVIEVLERHGYDIPTVADLCAGAALKVADAQVVSLQREAKRISQAKWRAKKKAEAQ